MILTESSVKEAHRTVRAIAFAAHPENGSLTVDVVVARNGRPCGDRIRGLVAEKLGEDWVVLDWHTTGDEF